MTGIDEDQIKIGYEDDDEGFVIRVFLFGYLYM